MKSLFFIFIVILTIPLLAQTTQCVSYNYDEAGNRIKRRIINMTNLAVTTNNYVNETINESENLESLDYLPP